MKVVKKIFSFCLVVLISVCFSWEGRALLGNAHYVIGEKVIEKMKTPLTGMEKSAFLSGMVYADIGRLNFDTICGVKSDSREFLEVLKNNATTDQEKWFVKGVEMHILQDEMTTEFLMNSFETEIYDYSAYIMQCGLVDYHFFKKSGRYIYSDFLELFNFNEIKSLSEVKTLCEALKIPVDEAESTCKFILKHFYDPVNKNPISSCDDLLIKTYQAFGFEVTREEIHKQQANMLGAFIITTFIIGNKQELNPMMIDIIENESEKIATICAEHVE